MENEKVSPNTLKKISGQEKNFYNYNFCSLIKEAKEIKTQAIELEKIFVISILNKEV